MKSPRRTFAKLLGLTIVAPVVPQGTVRLEAASALVQRAEGEVETGLVSADVTRALLDAQGPRGIFDEPEAFERLRQALTEKLQVHRFIRDYPVPDDVEPLLQYRR